MKLRVALVLSVISCAAASGAELTTVSGIDLKRYQGLWYEIARKPNRFQKSCTGNVTAEYKLRVDGEIDVINRCQLKSGEYEEARGEARQRATARSAGKLQVRFAPKFLSFLPFVWGDYWVLELSDDYSYAVVGEPSRNYLWILSRKPQMDPDVYQELISRIAGHGYDPSQVVQTLQTTR
jgi:apolipoprotein D and lipocalin family protein